MGNRPRVGSLLAMGLVCLLAIAAYAADGDFSGKWKGQAKAAPPPTRGAPGAAPAGTADAAPTPVPAEVGAPAPSGFGGGGGGGRGGGRGGGGGPVAGAPGGFGGGAGATQKVSLNLKQSKDNKLSGNITFNEGNPDDVKDGKVEAGRITFSAGRAPQPIYAFTGEMKDNELVLTRIAPAGGRGPRTTEFILTKK